MTRIAILLMGLPVLVTAQTIEFEADGDARFIRCTDMFGTASCEVILDSDADYYECVALDAAGEPVASGSAMPGLPVIYNELDAATVADVVCRRL